MAILPDHLLRARLADRSLIVDPLGPGAIQPSSIDLRLGPIIKIATPDGFEEYDLTERGPYRLQQHTFILASTLETVGIPDDLVGVLVGKSSRAREGIQVEAAGYVDPGWRGQLTLEAVKLSPYPVTYLMAGMAICQLVVMQMAAPAARPYGRGIGRYQHSTGPVESRAVIGAAS